MRELTNNRLEALLQQFAFEELSAADKSFILEELSEEEYRAFRQISFSASAIPSPSIPLGLKSTIGAAMAEAHAEKQTNIGRLLGYKVPFWLAACLAISVFFTTQSIGNDHPIETSKQDKIEQGPDPIYVYHTDTIYKEIISEPLIITKVIEKIVYIEREVPETQGFADLQVKERNTMLNQNEIDNQADFFSNKEIDQFTNNSQKGRTVSQDAALMGILDEIEKQVMLK